MKEAAKRLPVSIRIESRSLRGRHSRLARDHWRHARAQATCQDAQPL